MTIAIYGNMGSGKNQLAILHAFVAHQKYPTWNIFSNFHLKCPLHSSCSKFKFLEYANDFIDMQFTPIPKMVILDELYQWGADSRLHDRLATAIANKQLQSRHFNICFVSIAQVPSSLDRRIRELPRIKFYAMKPSLKSFNYAQVDCFPEQFFSISKNWAAEHIWPYYDHKEVVELKVREN